jgi:hypothetical protein
MAEGGNQNMVSGGGDILTVQKNGVIAINNLAVYFKRIADNTDQISLNSGPSTTSTTVAASTTQLIVAGTGRLFAVSIPAYGGSGQVFVYNSATTGAVAATNLIFASLPASATGWLTYYNVNLAYSKGLVIKTDASMNCAVSYTPTP